MRQIPSLNKEHGTNSRKAESLRADRNHEEAQRKKGSVAWTTWFPPGRLSTSVLRSSSLRESVPVQKGVRFHEHFEGV